MIRFYLWLARPRFILVGAVIANIVHPLIHGTPLDSGALDGCLMAVNATALCCKEDS